MTTIDAISEMVINEVELTQNDVAMLALQPGQQVRLLPSRLKLFERPPG